MNGSWNRSVARTRTICARRETNSGGLAEGRDGMAGDRCRATTDKRPSGLASRRVLATRSWPSASCPGTAASVRGPIERPLPTAVPQRLVRPHGSVGDQLRRVSRIRLDRDNLLDAPFLVSRFELERHDVESLGCRFFWQRELETLTVRGDGCDLKRLLTSDDDLSGGRLAGGDNSEKDVASATAILGRILP